jgi:cytochrome c556
MKKIAVAAILLTAFGTCVAFAGPIEDRQDLMKSFGGVGGKVRPLLASGATFDGAAAKAQMQILVDGAARIPGLFPPGSDTGTARSNATPAVWSDSAGFQAAAAKLGTDAQAAMAAPDQASFATAWQTVNGDCGGCHRTYRAAPAPRPAPPAAQ